jgi:hypothetical protein
MFEAGLEAILIGAAKVYVITGNLIAWSGQRVMSNAIDVTAATTGDYASCTITGNSIQNYTKSAVAIRGNHFEVRLDPNAVRYMANAASYTGSGALTDITHYRYDLSGVTGLIASDMDIVGGVMPRVGHYDLFPNHPYLHRITRDDYFAVRGSSYRDSLTFTAGQAVTIAQLKDATDGSNNYQGRVRVFASSGTSNTSKKAYYDLSIYKTAAGAKVTEMDRGGYSDGTAADDAAFIWTVSTSNNTLIATAVGSTAGTFNFTLQFDGNIIVG